MSENKNKNDNIQAWERTELEELQMRVKNNEALTNENEKDVEIGRFQLYNSM